MHPPDTISVYSVSRSSPLRHGNELVPFDRDALLEQLANLPTAFQHLPIIDHFGIYSDLLDRPPWLHSRPFGVSTGPGIRSRLPPGSLDPAVVHNSRFGTPAQPPALRRAPYLAATSQSTHTWADGLIMTSSRQPGASSGYYTTVGTSSRTNATEGRELGRRLLAAVKADEAESITCDSTTGGNESGSNGNEQAEPSDQLFRLQRSSENEEMETVQAVSSAASAQLAANDLLMATVPYYSAEELENLEHTIDPQLSDVQNRESTIDPVFLNNAAAWNSMYGYPSGPPPPTTNFSTNSSMNPGMGYSSAAHSNTVIDDTFSSQLPRFDKNFGYANVTNNGNGVSNVTQSSFQTVTGLSQSDLVLPETSALTATTPATSGAHRASHAPSTQTIPSHGEIDGSQYFLPPGNFILDSFSDDARHLPAFRGGVSASNAAVSMLPSSMRAGVNSAMPQVDHSLRSTAYSRPPVRPLSPSDILFGHVPANSGGSNMPQGSDFDHQAMGRAYNTHGMPINVHPAPAWNGRTGNSGNGGGYGYGGGYDTRQGYGNINSYGNGHSYGHVYGQNSSAAGYRDYEAMTSHDRVQNHDSMRQIEDDYLQAREAGCIRLPPPRSSNGLLRRPVPGLSLSRSSLHTADPTPAAWDPPLGHRSRGSQDLSAVPPTMRVPSNTLVTYEHGDFAQMRLREERAALVPPSSRLSASEFPAARFYERVAAVGQDDPVQQQQVPQGCEFHRMNTLSQQAGSASYAGRRSTMGGEPGLRDYATVLREMEQGITMHPVRNPAAQTRNISPEFWAHFDNEDFYDDSTPSINRAVGPSPQQSLAAVAPWNNPATAVFQGQAASTPTKVGRGQTPTGTSLGSTDALTSTQGGVGNREGNIALNNGRMGASSIQRISASGNRPAWAMELVQNTAPRNTAAAPIPIRTLGAITHEILDE